ncbi:ribosomal protein L3 [Tieghemostelium lacteum]|uniref:Large ribosomal subunit protein uL3m n=1 Tax=Tieghemostelium lacteum TaxID=361077 RepID=A0A151Z3X0_TIELA|nr:ribosomal protein L3 [Tieghemostelium lacteum]|eukprot:KYQ88660.1 ribosomal protein L3 [Tieghemostelium lacteum]
MNNLFRRNIFQINEMMMGRKRGIAGSLYIPKPSFGQKLQEAPFLRDTKSGWTHLTHRVGAIGKKIGMVTTYIDGIQYPATVIQIPSNQVTQIKRLVNDGVDSVQIGADEIRLKNVNKQQQGHFAKIDVAPKRVLMEFPVTRNALKNLNVGTTISAKHFVPGQLINVQGISKGKGFAGAMKRWNFRGQPATHGVSRTHRSIGSTGCRQTPGRVFKGKKMPGRLGGEKCTEQNLQVIRINTEMNCIMVKGAVPGGKNGYLRLTDSRSNKWKSAPPFPTYFTQPGEMEEELVISKTGQVVVESSYPTPIQPKLLTTQEYEDIMQKNRQRHQDQLLKIEKKQEENSI